MEWRVYAGQYQTESLYTLFLSERKTSVHLNKIEALQGLDEDGEESRGKSRVKGLKTGHLGSIVRAM